MKNSKNNANNQYVINNVNRKRDLLLRLEKDANNIYYFYKLRKRAR